MERMIGAAVLAALAAGCAPEPAEVNLADFQLAAQCTPCHGPAGRSPGSIPALNGMDQALIEERLKAFRAGTLESTVMGRLARGYTDDEITRIAAWFAAQGGSE